MGRNGPDFTQTPLGGVGIDSFESERVPTPPERRNETPISKDIGNKRSGGCFHTRPERLPERFVSIVPARSGLLGVVRW